MSEDAPPEESLADRLKYYTTLTLGTTACLSSFIFMFLIPWVLDPSISTLMANFDPEPVLCKTVQSDNLIGMKNCSWSSCKHGCTTDQFLCDQIYVNYMHLPYSVYLENMNAIDEDNDDIWVGRGVPLFVNIKACGYPPSTNCSVFGDTHSIEGTTFGCYYSRVDPNLIITNYDWDYEVRSIIMALLIPNVLCGLSLGIVSYWWYPGCQKRRCQYQVPPDQEEASSNNHDGDDDEDDDEDDDREYDEDGDDRESLDNREEGDMKNKQQEEEKDRDTSINMPEEKV